jgi:SAM-dependent methyltransferase
MDHAPVQNSSGAAWNKYGSWNRRHEGLAEVWVRDLVLWLKSNPLCHDQTSLLDFGCGYFDVGLALSGLLSRVDGFDLSADTCDIAAQRAQPLAGRSQIYRTLSKIPSHAYDIIVVNSVIQYFADLEVLRQHFFLWKSILKDTLRSQIILADLIPESYVSWRDAIRSIEVAWQEKMLLPMAIHLWKAAAKPKELSLLKVNFEDLRTVARSADFKVELLPFNLTPSRQRYSVIVSKG